MLARSSGPGTSFPSLREMPPATAGDQAPASIDATTDSAMVRVRRRFDMAGMVRAVAPGHNPAFAYFSMTFGLSAPQFTSPSISTISPTSSRVRSAGNVTV